MANTAGYDDEYPQCGVCLDGYVQEGNAQSGMFCRECDKAAAILRLSLILAAALAAIIGLPILAKVIGKCTAKFKSANAKVAARKAKSDMAKASSGTLKVTDTTPYRRLVVARSK